MTSRKSSILKPRKAREPLQDLNQLLPNNDDEETTTEVHKRRVSFASMNKVKEFEVAAECVTLLNTPGYDERVHSSSGSSQSTVETVLVQKESINPVDLIENICPVRQSIFENPVVNDDMEYTETIDRVYDTPMKSSGDSSMEMTQAVGCVTRQESFEEITCSLNMTKNSNTTSASFVDMDLIDMDLTNKTNFADNSGDSSMETTEVITNAVIKEESLIPYLNTDPDTSSKKITAETTTALSNNVLFEAIQIQSLFHETLHDENVNEEIEHISMNDDKTPAPPRKSIFEISTRQSTISSQWRVSRKSMFGPQSDAILLTDILNANNSETEIIDGKNTDLNESRVPQLGTANIEDSSIRVLSQPQACSTKLLSQLENKTKLGNSSMELLSQENVEDGTEPRNVDNKTQYDNSSMQLISQENDNKTVYDSATMQLMSQDTTNKTNYDQSSMQLATQETKCDDDNELENNDNDDRADGQSLERSDGILVNRQPAELANEKEPESDPAAEKIQSSETNENIHEISQKSLADVSSSGNDSSSPLTLDVNVSIFIDPKKKKNSIPNVLVNIVNNKPKQQKRNMKELRFSMPATIKSASSEETTDRPEFWATFTNDSTPRDDAKSTQPTNTTEMKNMTEVEEISKKQFGLTLDDEKMENMLTLQLSKPTQKRLSSEAFEDQTNGDFVATKRRSLDDCPISEPTLGDSIETTKTEQQQHVVTEIKERRESIVRECKSVVTVNDVTRESHAKSSNLNVSIESRQITTIDSPEESKTATSYGMLSSMSSLKMKDRSPEIRSDAGSVDQSFSTTNRTPSQLRQTRSINQSVFQDDEIVDCSLHNPSIIVNIGDSFSHYKSMDLSVDENNDAFSNDDAKIETINLINNIETESMSKENFVTDWLQNKMNVINTDGKTTERVNLTAVSGSSRGESPALTVTEKSTEDEHVENNEISTPEVMVASTNEQTSEELSAEPSDIPVEKFSPKRSLTNDDQSDSAPVRALVNECDQSKHEIFVADQKDINERNDDDELPKKIRDNVSEPATSIENVQLVEENDGAFSDYRTTTDERPQTPEIIENTNANRETNDDFITESTLFVNVSPSSIDPIIAKETELINVGLERVSLDDVQPSDMAEKAIIDEILVDMEIDNVDEDEIQSIDNHEVSIEEKYEQISSSPAGCKKRRTVSPKCEKIKNVNISFCTLDSTQSSQYSTKSETHDLTLFPDSKYANRRRDDSKTTRDVKRETLKKIEEEYDVNTEWKLKTASNKEWTFEFLYGHLELSINLCDDSTLNCTASMHFIPVSKRKAVKLMEIAINSVIRKYESSVKSLCQTVEDVPYLLKLIVPDVLYAKKFVIAMLKLEDSDYVKIKNDRAQFYVCSYKNHILLKIMVNIKYLEKTGVNDIEVKEIVGKADMNLIRTIFSEAGRDADFFAKFVKRLWQELDPR